MTAVPVDSLTTAALVDAVRPAPQSNDVLFASLYRRFFRVVRAWGKSLGGQRCDPDDIAQNVFVVVYRRLPEFDGKNVAGWLYRITVNQVRDERRSVWDRVRAMAERDELDQIASPVMTPARALEVQRDLAAVSETLRRVSGPTRAAFLSFQIEGYTGKELAARNRTSLASVYGRVRGARIALLGQVAGRTGSTRSGRPRGGSR